MRKSNKGFTLVELLAVIVILGILAVFALPQIVGVMDKSRNKMYVSDALKLISLAEYEMRASNSRIEKPDPGDCIAISMNYLSNDDFDTAPNDGIYLRDSSFVVVKNNNGKLEYSVSIIEGLTDKKSAKKKSAQKIVGYKGIELVRSSQLSQSKVKVFNKSELISLSNSSNIGTYINSRLKTTDNYINNLDNVPVYYNPEIEDNSVVDDPSVPKIVSLKVAPIGSSFNSLNVKLTLKVTDSDTNTKNLKVFISYNSYDNPTQYSYGNSNNFTVNLDLSAVADKYDGEVIPIYVVVRDPENNEAKKIYDYKLHTDIAPEIVATSLTSTDISKNLLTTNLYLKVVDDIGNIEDLNVCFKEEKDAKTCDDYKRYGDLFDDDNIMKYTFNQCSGGCKLDGSEHPLTVFVKDNSGNESIVSVYDATGTIYKVYKNEKPSIVSTTITSVYDSVITKMLDVNVSINVSDDLDDVSAMTVVLTEKGNTSNTKNCTDLDSCSFKFSGTYDGKARTLIVRVTDTSGEFSEKSYTYTPYKNIGATVNSINITSATNVCDDQNLCPDTDGGATLAKIDLDISDDIDNSSNLLVCISEDSNNCSTFENYKQNYIDTTKYYLFTSNLTKPYDGSTKTLYVFVIDSYEVLSKSSSTYKLYQNKAPVINNLSVMPDYDSSSSGVNVIINSNVNDDLTATSNLTYSLYHGTSLIKSDKFIDFTDGIKYKVADNYDGTDHTFKIVVTDEYGSSSELTEVYTISENLPPSIYGQQIYGIGTPCSNASLCPEGSLNTNIKFELDDDFSSADKLKFCVSENASDCANALTYIDYSSYMSSGYQYTIIPTDSTKPYDGSLRTIYLFAADENGKTSHEVLNYRLYKNSSPIINSVSVESKNSNYNINKIKVSLNAYDDFDLNSDLQVNICYVNKDDGTSNCTGYQNYVSSYDVTLFADDVNNYHGQGYDITVKVKDSYDAVTNSNVVSYYVFNDQHPQVIDLQSVFYTSSESSGPFVWDSPTEVQKIKTAFSVKDTLDKYSVCISTSNSTCTEYSDWFDGTNLNYNSIIIDKDSDDTHYLFVKDKYNNVVVQEFTPQTYSKCNSGTISPNYSFTLKIGETDISASRCSGSCYYTSTVNQSIVSNYNKTITSRDILDTSNVCTKTEDYQAHCDFHLCFKINGQYSNFVIGTKVYESSIPITVGGTTYNTGHYFKVYSSSYTSSSDKITLTPLDTRVPATYNNSTHTYDVINYYKFQNGVNNYVRVAD